MALETKVVVRDQVDYGVFLFVSFGVIGAVDYSLFLSGRLS